MRQNPKVKSGIQLLFRKYRAVFRSPENPSYDAKNDDRNAERKFLKYVLEQRRLETQEELFSE